MTARVESRRSLLPFPDESTLGDAVRNGLLAADRRLPDLAGFDLDQLEADIAQGPAGRRKYADLAHPLSPWITQRTLARPNVGRSRLEAEVLDRHGADLTRACEAGDQAFADAVTRVGSSLVGRATALRRSGAATAPDGTGASIRFPEPDLIPARLALLRAVVGERRFGSAVLTAGVILAAFVNCHPFPDGNGRTGRFLFNWILRANGLRESVYIPLYEIFLLSGGGYELRLRQAELRGDWEDYLAYICRVLDTAATFEPVQ